MTRDTHTPDNGEPDIDALPEFFRPRNRVGSGEPLCPPPELLRALRGDTLSPILRDRTAAHVARCTPCQVLADAIDELPGDPLTTDEQDRILARVRTQLGPQQRTAGPWWTAAAAAAAIVLTATGVQLWQSRGVPPSTEDASVLRLEKPAVRLAEPPSGIARERSVDSAPLQELSPALQPYRADHFDEAASRLTALVNRFPRDSSAQFYLGVTELLIASRTPSPDSRKRYAQAIAALETARSLAADDPERASDADWFLALGYLGIGQNQRAAEKLAAVCRGSGTHAEQACAGLGELAGGSSLDDPPPRRPPPQ
jgi:hypothetical protein